MVKIIMLSTMIFFMCTSAVYTNEEDVVANIEVVEVGENIAGKELEDRNEDKLVKKAEKAFYNLIENEETKNEFIPLGTKVLGVKLENDSLIVNVSKDITSYGGGTALEYEIMCQLLNTAFKIKEVNSFTFLVEGGEIFLPEGTVIMDYTRERYMKNVARY